MLGEVQAEIIELAGDAWRVVFQTWTIYQALIIAAAFGLSRYIAKHVEPPLETWVRGLKLNAGFLRLLAALLRRVEWIAFVILVGTAFLIVSSYTWPSRAFFLNLAFNLSLAWLVISVISRVIHSRQLSRWVAVLAWIIVALNLTGYLDPTTRALDSIAFHLGEVRLSALILIKSIALLIGLTWLATNTGNFVETRVKGMPDLTPSLQVLIGKFIKIFLVIAAVIVALNAVGIDLTVFAVFSGAIGVGLGFGLQKVVSNFISGVIILMDKSIKPGDTISLGETFGWIRELRSRFVSVVTRDGREFLIPNEDFITEKVINWSFTDKLVRLDVDFGVSYDSNPHDVSRYVIEAVESVERVSNQKRPVCWLTEFGDSSLNFRARFWISDPQNGLTNIRGIVMLAIWDTFQANNIGIPYPHREIIMQPPKAAATASDEMAESDAAANPKSKQATKKPGKAARE
ncbi:MAG: mechanosensitive ion channel domain-containing protein [Rhizobiaceae bacterium]